MKIKVNNVPGYSGTVAVEDNKGIPVDRFWRNRLKDAKIDNCCEVVTTRAKKSEEKAK